MTNFARLLAILSGSTIILGTKTYPKYIQWENFRFIEDRDGLIMILILDDLRNPILAFKQKNFDQVLDFIYGTINKKDVAREVQLLHNIKSL